MSEHSHKYRVTDVRFAWSVIGGLVLSMILGPIFGLFGLCFGDQRQRGGWLMGSGVGGMLNSIPYIIAGPILLQVKRIADDAVSQVESRRSSRTSSHDYEQSIDQVKGAMETITSFGTAFTVIGVLFFIIGLSQLIFGVKKLRRISSTHAA